jgi:hypothetical protein
MYYICIENDRVTSALNYEPNVPASTRVVTITDEEYACITEAQTHYFDIVQNAVTPHAQKHLDAVAVREKQLADNAENMRFLNSTDWKVMRHLREKTLNKPTTLSDEEFLALEVARAAAAAAILPV